MSLKNPSKTEIKTADEITAPYTRGTLTGFQESKNDVWDSDFDGEIQIKGINVKICIYLIKFAFVYINILQKQKKILCDLMM